MREFATDLRPVGCSTDLYAAYLSISGVAEQLRRDADEVQSRHREADHALRDYRHFTASASSDDRAAAEATLCAHLLALSARPGKGAAEGATRFAWHTALANLDAGESVPRLYREGGYPIEDRGPVVTLFPMPSLGRR